MKTKEEIKEMLKILKKSSNKIYPYDNANDILSRIETVIRIDALNWVLGKKNCQIDIEEYEFYI